jgi:L-lactate dehydrogenase complex protein LldG
MSARDDVLARVRQALGPTREAADVSRSYRVGGELDRAAVLDLFVDRLVDYKAAVRRTEEAGLDSAIAGALAARGADNLVVPTDLARWGTVDDGFSAHELDRFDGVLTGATVAVAETGTIVLDGSPDQGRRAITLVPDYHLCVVRANQVVQTVPEAVARLDATRPLTWISGPSATSDIELQRVEGVHGPRTLEVILVDG